MCGAVEFAHHGQILKSYFPNPKAMLPVLKRDGTIELLGWGRRQKQPGKLPLGGWARLDSIYAGRWQAFKPTPVKIPALRFMEKDFSRRSHWYQLVEAEYIQGLVARDGNEMRIYVVTVDAEDVDREFHDRVPRIIRLYSQAEMVL